jgi:hypothetical protein
MGTELVVVTPSLDELAATANHEHARVLEAGVSMVEHAIKAGEALIAAKGLLPFGAWNQWLDAKFEAGCKATARNYMRIARHRALLESCEPAGLVDALRLIAGEDRSDRDLIREREMKALRASGLTYKAIATMSAWRRKDAPRDDEPLIPPAAERWSLVLTGPALVVLWVVSGAPDWMLAFCIPIAGLFAVLNLILDRRRRR